MYRDGHIFLYSVRWAGQWILYIWSKEWLATFFFVFGLIAMENVCLKKKKRRRIWCDFLFPCNVPVRQAERNDENRKEEENRKLYSAKLCKYTLFTLRSVSKSNILKMDFVYYCTVQDSALNVLLLLLLLYYYYDFFSMYYYYDT